MAGVIEFVRGDQNRHTFAMPASAWSAGGRLFFAAKQVIDDDTTDALALVQANFDDSVVSDVMVNGVAYKQYECIFPPAATNNIESDGALSLRLLGEFQWVDSGGIPHTFPPKDPKLECIVYFDVKRKTTP